MRYLPLLSLLFLYLTSCNSRNQHSTNNEALSVDKLNSFEKLDSIQIDFLGNPIVHDIHPESRTILFLDDGPYAQTIFIAKFDGEIINSFSKFGDMPDSYGKLLSTIRLMEGERFLVYGYNGFLTYDFEGNLLSRQKLLNFKIPDSSPIFMGHGMEKLGDEYLYINQEFPPNIDYSDKTFLYELKLLKILYPESGEIKLFIQFSENSLFRNGKLFFRNAWDPVFHLGDNLIYVVFGLEPVIYAYEDSPPHTLVSNIPIEFNEFRNFKGVDSFTDEVESFTDRFKSAFIENIKKIDGYFLIAYFPGYDGQDMEESKTNKSPDEWAIFREKIQKKYPRRIAIIDSFGNVINDFVPEGLDPKSMLLRNGELWMMEKPDEEIERDYFRLFKVGLKIEDL